MDIFEIIDDSTNRPSTTMRDLMGLSEAEIAERQARSAQFIQGIFDGTSEDNSGPDKLRTLIECDAWYVPIKANGEFEFLNVKKGEYPPLIARVSKEDGRRTVREGTGGQFLPIYRSAPQGQFKQVDGRTLVRQLPEKVTGLLVDFDYEDEDVSFKELYADEHFDTLRSLLPALELEALLLASDEFVNTAELRKANFRVVTINNGQLCAKSEIVGTVASASTHEFLDAHDDECKIEVMTGEELFKRIVASDNLDGLKITGGNIYSDEWNRISNMVFSLNFLHRALTQDRCSFRYNEPIVRNREEFELWLAQTRFPKEREIVEAVVDGRKVIYAKSAVDTDEWAQHECLRESGDKVKVTTSNFEIRPEPTREPGFGRGPSSVLCPGLLADTLYRTARDADKSKSKPPVWKPGLNLGFCRILSDSDIAASKERLTMARELLKLLPRGEKKIPRTAMLSVDGARCTRERFPETATREWIEATVKEAEASSRKKLIFGA